MKKRTCLTNPAFYVYFIDSFVGGQLFGWPLMHTISLHCKLEIMGATIMTTSLGAALVESRIIHKNEKIRASYRRAKEIFKPTLKYAEVGAEQARYLTNYAKALFNRTGVKVLAPVLAIAGIGALTTVTPAQWYSAGPMTINEGLGVIGAVGGGFWTLTSGAAIWRGAKQFRQEDLPLLRTDHQRRVSIIQRKYSGPA